VVNISGCIIDAILYIIKLRFLFGTVHEADHDIVTGISVGFCGALTTVSSFTNEVYLFKEIKHGYRYALISMIVAQIFLIFSIGAYVWTH